MSALVGACSTDPDRRDVDPERPANDASLHLDATTSDPSAARSPEDDVSTSKTDAGSSDADKPDAQASTQADAGGGFGGPCSTQDDCTLVPNHCCGCSISDTTQAQAYSGDSPPSYAICTDVLCGACRQLAFDPLSPAVVAACVQGACEVVDVRKRDASRCLDDSDCKVIYRDCCAPCSSDPGGYLAVGKGENRSELACGAAPACLPCPAVPSPSAYCAADKHCAIRQLETVGGQPSTRCFSPTQYEQPVATELPGLVAGCDCVLGTEPACLDTPFGRMGLSCVGGGTSAHWEQSGPESCR